MHKAHQGKAVPATDLFYDYVESKTGKFSNRSVNRIVAGLKSELIEKCCFEADSIVELRGLICRWMRQTRPRVGRPTTVSQLLRKVAMLFLALFFQLPSQDS
jgi:hypothetical protein